jgi:ATP-dependent helicase HrpB
MTSSLPIQAVLADLQHSLETHSNVILSAEPGAGKSTALPLSLLAHPRFSGQRIVMLEPRRVAAKAIAQYLAYQLGEPVGQTVGYQVRNDRKRSKETRLEIVTEGILTQRLQSDPSLEGVGLVIFDEFHERSVYADIALMLCQEVQQALRPDLRLLVMSATIDHSLLTDYLPDAATIRCPGRSFPIGYHYRHTPSAALREGVVNALKEVLAADTQGDILVFLPGKAEIRRVQEAIASTLEGRGLTLATLHGDMPLASQTQVLAGASPGQRRVILATNIAETSLTIEGVGVVIDSGLERRQAYEPAAGTTRLITQAIAKSSAAQRAGRAGRLGPGHCWRLWSEDAQARKPDYPPEDILAEDLTDTLFELLRWGYRDPSEIPWLTAPPQAHIDTALSRLQALGVIDAKRQLTALGLKVGKWGLPAAVGALLAGAETEIEQQLACDIAALLSERDIFVGSSSADFGVRYAVLHARRGATAGAGQTDRVQEHVVKQVLALADRYRRLCGVSGAPDSRPPGEAALFYPLARLFPLRLAKQHANDAHRYQLAAGPTVRLAEGDSLAQYAWLLVLDFDGRRAEGRIYSALGVSARDAEAFIEPFIEVEHAHQLSADEQKFSLRAIHRYGALTIAAKPLPEARGEALHAILPALLRRKGLSFFEAEQPARQWLHRVQWLSQFTDALCVDNQGPLTVDSLWDNVEAWLIPYVTSGMTLGEVKKLPLTEMLTANLSWPQQQLLQTEAPTEFRAPSGRVFSIRYDDAQAPVVALPLQDVFGLTESPRIGCGRVPLRFELLSPARRPLQTTSDLAHFWQHAYIEIAKEMRGRYPKHRWPEQPLEAAPGPSSKRFTG